jgi:hypothetical protein
VEEKLSGRSLRLLVFEPQLANNTPILSEQLKHDATFH